MKKEDYKLRPNIDKPEDLLKFLQQIPAKFWCADRRNDHQGRHCVLGHLDNAYGYQRGRDGFTDGELATVNNGTIEVSWGKRKRGISLSGRAVKARVLKFIRSRIKTNE